MSESQVRKQVKEYYRNELDLFDTLSQEFYQAHPDAARGLKGRSIDPDAERLLQGTAFLTSLLKFKIDDEFPDFICELTNLLFPHYLRPIPATTIMRFLPNFEKINGPMSIPRGTRVASREIDSVSCLFETCNDIEMHPLSLNKVMPRPPEIGPPAIQLQLSLEGGLRLADWKVDNLRFFLGPSEDPVSTLLYLILSDYLGGIVIRALDHDATFELPASHLQPAGFDLDKESLFPYPSHSFPGYQLLQEYFILPEKFLFMELTGLEQWRDRGKGTAFEISFDLNLKKTDGRRTQSAPQIPYGRINTNHFTLFAVPAVNLFRGCADPVDLNHRKPEYKIDCQGQRRNFYRIHSITSVVGSLKKGSYEERVYQPFSAFHRDPMPDQPVYHVAYRKSLIRPAEEYDLYLSIPVHPKSPPPREEVLTIGLWCTDGYWPEENLAAGDLNQGTENSPGFADFENLFTPTPFILPPLGSNLLWRLISHLSLNYLPIENANNLKALLNNYIFEDCRNSDFVSLNKRRVAGIVRMHTEIGRRIAGGILMQGHDISMEARDDHFRSTGDLFLFGRVLDRFLAAYGTLNAYTSFSVRSIPEDKWYPFRPTPRIGFDPLQVTVRDAL